MNHLYTILLFNINGYVLYCLINFFIAMKNHLVLNAVSHNIEFNIMILI